MQTILIAEDDTVQCKMLSLLLTKRLGYAVIETRNGKEAVERVRASNVGDISAVLLDISMPVMDGFAALRAIRTYRADLPVIMLTGTDDAATAVKAIKQGANDFIAKPADPAHLGVALANAIRLSALTHELALMKRDKEGALTFLDLVGHDNGLADAVSYGRRAAASDVPVLINGETGVGKELFARAIHGESKRVGAPFIAINCGAIPENLVESTLFGHERGAFTGATTRTIGKFREAEGGTIFLDEVGELPLEAQVKLLRVLQQKEVEPVGAGRPVKINVRLLSATNRDLARDVQAGRFREDLFFRLNVLPVTVPPLRERKEDILSLAEYFIRRLSAAEGLATKPLSKDAEFYLMQSYWGGNVRELENVIHRVLVLTESDIIDRAALAQLHTVPAQVPLIERRALPEMSIGLRHPDGMFKTMSEIEQESLQMALAHFEQNVTRAADALGIAKSTFYRKIKDAIR